MTLTRPGDSTLNQQTRTYRDLHEHIAALEERGLLRRITREINKDTELHPLVRWQFRGGIREEDRKAWLFENIVDSRGRRYDIPVLVGGMAANQAIYATGLGCEVADIPAHWERALANPIPPVLVEDGPVHEVVLTGDELLSRGGMDEFPVPISTPGWDNAPYLTLAHWTTKDPDTGIQNMGNYRGQLKSPTRIGLNFRSYQHGSMHWAKYGQRGEPMPAAIVVGGPPVVSYAAVTKVPFGVDELAVAGGLAGAPIRAVKCKTVDLVVPAEAELVIEGYVRTDVIEPEGPFGESHGYVHPQQMNPWLEVTAITHRRDMVFVSIISQVTPSESSAIKIAGYESVFLKHLRDNLSIKTVVKVGLYEPLLNIRPMIVIQMRKPTRSDVWRALRGASSLQQGVGKLIVAVDEDIDPHDADAVLWAMCYRAKPHLDMEIGKGVDRGHAPPFYEGDDGDRSRYDYYQRNDHSTLLVDAILKEKFPPVSLPKREYMEHAKQIWEELGLPPLTPRAPWFGYSLGDWNDEWEEESRLAVEGRYYETGEKQSQRRQPKRH